jgi:M6 family metalloprotease-like protein/uncharacterized repeat protein (TIGR02543 family)
MRVIKKWGKTAFVTMVFLLLFSTNSFAARIEGDIVTLTQPDQSKVQVKVWGDEFYTHVESLDGYTVVLDDKTGYVCFAKLNSNGAELVSSGVIYTGTERKDEKDFKVKNKKSIKEPKETIIKKVKKAQSELFANGTELVTETVSTVADPLTSPSSNPYYNSYYSGAIKGLTLLIAFPDEGPTITAGQIDAFCNSTNYTDFGNSGSVRQYFSDASGGLLDYTNYVPQYYYTAKYPKSYYTDSTISYGTRARELANEAITNLATKGFDFNTLSKDQYGRVRALNMFYVGGRDNAWAQGLWPHSGSLNSTISGVAFGKYQITNIGSSLSIGTFCHENGHMICNWADTYDYDSDSKGTGKYDLMSSSGTTNPVLPNPYFRSVLCGWGDLSFINGQINPVSVSLPSNQINAVCLVDSTGNEFFMIENVQTSGRWAGFGTSGLYIWHCDKKFNVYGGNNYQDMTEARHYQVSIEQADGLFELERNIDSGDATDAFYSTNRTAFGSETLPSSKWWNGTSSGLEITNISAPGSVMTYNLSFGANLTYNVTFNSNGGTAVPSQTVKNNEMATLPTQPSKAGSVFAGWYTDANLTNAYNFATPVTSNLTLYAKWTVLTYTVQFNSNGGSSVPSQTVSYISTAKVPIAPTKAGYSFVGWYTASNLRTLYNFSTPVTSNLTLYAKWKAVKK